MKILYIDMDNVLVDFQSGINNLSDNQKEKYKDNYDNCPGIFSLMTPLDGAIEAYEKLAENMIHIYFQHRHGITLLRAKISFYGLRNISERLHIKD